jgi:hypothetical protein
MVKKVCFMLLCFSLMLCIPARAQDQGMTGETHKKNIGKILWAKERIKKDSQDQVKYESRFDATDPLYGRVFLQKGLLGLSQDKGPNCLNSGLAFQLKLFVDDKDRGLINQNNFEGSGWTTCQINFNLTPGDSEDAINQGVSKKWLAAVNELAVGEHAVKVEFWAGTEQCPAKYAEGAFTLVKASDKKVSGSSKLPEAKKSDAALEAEMIGAIKERQWQNEAPVKVVIIESDWRIIRNAFGVILRKEINTNVVLKKNDGACRLTDISFIQPWQSGEKYGRTEVYGIGLMNSPIDCDAAK